MITQKDLNEWLNQNFQLIEVDDSLQMFRMPIFPLDGEALTLYIENQDNRYIISDRGQTYGNISVLYGKNEDEMSAEQREFVETIIKDTEIDYETNKGFRLTVKNTNEIIESCFDLATNLIPVYYSLILKEKEREIKFSRNVITYLKEEVPNLKSNIHLKLESGGDSIGRQLDFLHENSEKYFVGKIVAGKKSIDTAVTTWDLVNKLKTKEFKSKNLIQGKDISPLTIIDDNFKLQDVYEKILGDSSKLLRYPSEKSIIVSSIMPN